MGVPLTDEQSARSSSSSWSTSSRPRPRAEWVQRFLDADVCAVEHLRPTEVFDTPQARHNGMVVTVDDPVLGPVEQVAPAIKFTATPGEVTRSGAQRSASTPTTCSSTAAGWPAPDPPAAAPVPDTRPLLAGLRHRRPRRVLRGAVLVPPPRRPRRRRREDRALGRRPAAWHRTTVLLRAGREARDRGQPQGSGTGPRHRGAAAGAPMSSTTTSARARRSASAWTTTSVRSVNPDIVYLHAPGWGSTGPFAMRQSFAPMMSGYAGVTYEVAGQYNPPLPPSGNEDPGNGLLGAIAILLALLHRDRTGAGQFGREPAAERDDGATSRTSCARPCGRGARRRAARSAADGRRSVRSPLRDRSTAGSASSRRPTTSAEALLETMRVDRVDDDDTPGRPAARRVRPCRAHDAVVADSPTPGVAAVEPVGRNVHTFMNDPEHARDSAGSPNCPTPRSAPCVSSACCSASATRRRPRTGWRPGSASTPMPCSAELGCSRGGDRRAARPGCRAVRRR